MSVAVIVGDQEHQYSSRPEINDVTIVFGVLLNVKKKKSWSNFDFAVFRSHRLIKNYNAQRPSKNKKKRNLNNLYNFLTIFDVSVYGNFDLYSIKRLSSFESKSISCPGKNPENTRNCSGFD